MVAFAAGVTALLREAGIDVLPVPAYAPLVRRTNAHIVHD